MLVWHRPYSVVHPCSWHFSNHFQVSEADGAHLIPEMCTCTWHLYNSVTHLFDIVVSLLLHHTVE